MSRIGSDPVKTVGNLYIGGERIIAAMASLPKTKHDISGPPEKFCLDSFPIMVGQEMGLMLMVHGQFTEGPLFYVLFARYCGSYALSFLI